MQAAAALLRILGSVLYYSPEDPQIQALLPQLKTLPTLFNWQDTESIKKLCSQLVIPNQDDLLYEFSVLFEGQGEMPIPPWGSVYLDEFNLLMSDSTMAYRHFLDDQRLVFMSKINEPEDQIGLMLLALSVFVEQGNQSAVKTVLSEHLLPWAYRYLDLLADNYVSLFYAQVAKIIAIFLNELQSLYQVTPNNTPIYF